MGTIQSYGCIGERLTHSFSKEIHGLLGAYDYALQELPPEAVGAFLTEGRFRGINVTIPYKQTVIPYLDEMDDASRQIHAVNTVVRRDGRLFGYNTDFGGMRAMLLQSGMELRGRKVLILGTGGTSKTARAVAQSLGAAEILRVSRTAREDAISYEEAAARRDCQILINTTPVGMYPNLDEAPIDINLFPALEGVADVIYNPLRTVLTERARAKGIRAVNGLYMLVAQAALASELFLDAQYPSETVPQVYERILREKRNLVLIGMPSCGKTTVGKALAQRLGRRFIDTDDEIVKTCGMDIPQIFARYGESGFRDRESEVIRAVAPLSGCVIATGGGAILRGENVRRLRQNGRLILLDRPLSALLPTPDRPTAGTEVAIRQRYAERQPIYTAVAEEIVDASGAVSDVLAQILKGSADKP